MTEIVISSHMWKILFKRKIIQENGWLISIYLSLSCARAHRERGKERESESSKTFIKQM